jgi:hypothetical protein
MSRKPAPPTSPNAQRQRRHRERQRALRNNALVEQLERRLDQAIGAVCAVLVEKSPASLSPIDARAMVREHMLSLQPDELAQLLQECRDDAPPSQRPVIDAMIWLANSFEGAGQFDKATERPQGVT